MQTFVLCPSDTLYPFEHAQPSQEERIAQLEAEKAEYQRKLEEAVEELDLITRAVQNPKFSDAYLRMYISLIDTYPQALTGEPTTVQVSEVRKNAGWKSERTATAFFNDMEKAVKAFEYDPGKYDKDDNSRVGTLTTDVEVFPYPEYFNTKEKGNHVKAREHSKSQREAVREALLTLTCINCGSPDIEYGLLPTCKVCKHVHPMINHVPVDVIEINPDANVEAEDDFDIAFTEPPPPPPPPTRVAMGDVPPPPRRCYYKGSSPKQCVFVYNGARYHCTVHELGRA